MKAVAVWNTTDKIELLANEYALGVSLDSFPIDIRRGRVAINELQDHLAETNFPLLDDEGIVMQYSQAYQYH